MVASDGDLSFIISFLLLFPLHSLVLFAVSILPQRPSQHSSAVRLHSLSPSPLSCLSASVPVFLSPCTAEACVVCPSCASSGNCLPWYIIREPPGGTAPHAHGALTKMLHKCSARDVEHIESTTQRALKQPSLGKSDKLPQRDHILHGCYVQETTGKLYSVQSSHNLKSYV